MDVVSKRALETSLGVSDELELIAGLRNGDDACYERLVTTYGGRMLAVARRILRAEEDVRDCVQDAFVQAFRGIQGFEERSSLGSWLHRIVVNTALMKIRSRARRPEDSLEDLMPQFDEHGFRIEPTDELSAPVETLFEQRQTKELVRRTIDQLPDDYRNVLIARDIEGYDTQETAVLLGITPGAVKVRLHRARTALKSLLKSVVFGEVS